MRNVTTIDRQSALTRQPARLAAITTALLLGGSLATAAAPPPPPQKTVAFVCFYAANAFCDTILRGEKQEAAKLHANIRFLYDSPTQDTAEYQVPILNAMLARHPDALIVDVTNPREEIPVLRRFNRAHIPLIEVDQAVADPSIGKTFIGTHVFEGGQLAGKSIGDHLKGHGMLGIIDIAPGNVSSNKRAQGCIAWLKQNDPGIKILPVQYAGINDPLSAAKVASSMLVAHPEITAMFGTTGVLASGIGRAVIGAGRQGKVFVQSFDAPPEAVKLLKQGVISSTEVQQPIVMGRLAMQYTWDELTGHASLVPKQTLLPTITATTATASDPRISQYYYIPNAIGEK